MSSRFGHLKSARAPEIQLTERQLRLRRDRHQNESSSKAPSSASSSQSHALSASAMASAAKQEANKRTPSRIDQKSLLRSRMMARKSISRNANTTTTATAASTNTSAPSASSLASSSAATKRNHTSVNSVLEIDTNTASSAVASSESAHPSLNDSKSDQKASLRKLLAKTKMKRQHIAASGRSPKNGQPATTLQPNPATVKSRVSPEESNHTLIRAKSNALLDNDDDDNVHNSTDTKREPLRTKQFNRHFPLRNPSRFSTTNTKAASTNPDENQRPSRAASRSIFNRTKPPLSVNTKPLGHSSSRSDTAPRSQAALPTPEDSDSYGTFLEVLQKEVSGDHRELWRSFRSLFHPNHEIMPEVSPLSGVATTASGGASETKRKRPKFDEVTKKKLADMNNHLKRHSRMECKPETQLVNDRKYVKELKALPAKVDTTKYEFAAKLQQQQQQPGVVVQPPPRRKVTAPVESTLGRREVALEMVAVRPKLKDPAPIEERVKKVASLIEGSKQERWRKSQQERTKTDEAAKKVPPTEKKVKEPLIVRELSRRRWKRDRHSLPTAGEPVSLGGTKRSITESNGAAPAPAPAPAAAPWSSVQLKPRNTTESSDETDNTNGSNEPWKKVQLKSRNSDSTGPRSQDDGGSVPWASVNLRSNPKSIKMSPPKTLSARKSIVPISRIDPEEMREAEPEKAKPETMPEVETATDPPAKKKQEDPPVAPKKQVKILTLAKSFVPPSNGETTLPWKEIKLRPKNSTNHENNEDSSDSSGGAPWGAVKLRKVPSTEESAEEGEEENEEGDTALPFLAQLQKTATDPPPEGIDNGAVGTEPRKPVDAPENRNALMSQITARKPACAVPNAGRGDDRSQMLAQLLSARTPKKKTSTGAPKEIDFNSVSSAIHEADDEVVVVNLAREGGIVVLGNKMIVTGQRSADKDKATVDWHMARDKIKSLTLDMAQNRADLILSDCTTKPLDLENAEGCLHFTAAFYNMPAFVPSFVQIGGVGGAGSVMQQSAPAGLDPGDLTSIGMSMGEQLNEEEQRVLERYRQARKVKGADDALRETIRQEVGTPEKGLATANASKLSEKEEEIATKYRKMLKMGIPPDAVRHKLTKDGIAQNIVDDVLRPPSEDEARAKPKDPSGLNEKDEETAGKYRKMLKLKIPAEAVEHKMKKDGVSAAVMNAVLSTGSSATEPKPDALTPEEEKQAGKYKKMLKMGIPKDAVLHSLKKDQASEKIIKSVLGEDAVPQKVATVVSKSQSKAQLSEEEEKVALTYRKMLKMMIPPDAVKHRMKKDAVDSKIVFAIFPEEDEDKATKGPTRPSLSISEEAVAATYQKMLKLSIPADAVRHKMTKDGVDPKIVVFVLGDSHAAKSKENSLSPAEEKEVEKFQKMLRMGAPKDAVRHRMTKEGTSQKIVDAVFGKEPKKGNSQRRNRGSKLVALHWTPLSGEELNNSVWSTTNKKRKVSEALPETGDFSKLVELFQKKSNPKSGAPSAAKGGNESNNGKAKLIDLNRAQNVAISLKGFKEFTNKELAGLLAHLDPRETVRGERVQFLKDLLPTIGEVKSIKAYKGEDSRLLPAELFFKHIVHIKRLETKVEVLQTMDTFDDSARELTGSFETLQRACSQVQCSEKLQELLDMVLHIGNIMNEGTRTGGAAGFKFDSLLKLTQTKSSDGKTSVLDYLVMIFMAKNKRETLYLSSDCPDCQESSRMLITDMVNEVKTMSNSLNKCRSELKLLQEEAAGPKADPPGNAAGADPRAALFSAIKARGQGDTAGEQQPSSIASSKNKYLEAVKANGEKEKKEKDEIVPKKLDASLNPFLAAVSSCAGRGSDAIDSDDDEESKSEEKASAPERRSVLRPATLEGGIERLEEFISAGEQSLKTVEESRDKATAACKELSMFCGETGGERSASTLLGILSEFAAKLEEGVKKYDRRMELEAKKKAALKKKEESLKKKPSPLGSITEDGKDGSAFPKRDVAASQKEGNSAPAMSPPPNLPKGPKTPAPYDEANDSGFPVQQQLSIDERIRMTKSNKKGDNGESLVLMVNEMLKRASPKAKKDFANGVVADNADETLQKIYMAEKDSVRFRPLHPTSADGRGDLMSAIRSRGATLVE